MTTLGHWTRFAVAANVLAAMSGNSDTPITRTFLDQDSAVVRGDHDRSGNGGGREKPAGYPTVEEYRRSSIIACGIGPEGVLRFGPDCSGSSPAEGLVRLEPVCDPTDVQVDPLFRRTVNPGEPGGWSQWERLDDGCLPVRDIRAAVAQEFQRLPLTPSALSVQPPSGWTLVNADTIAFADGSSQLLTATVLGLDVAIRATPDTFTWAFGDGSAPLVTRDPGKPWPQHTVAHRYAAEGQHAISLTTTWIATYQVAGSTTWEPVDGIATTTSTSPPLTVYEARTRLVDSSAD